MTVKEWEQSEACNLMYKIEQTLWIPFSHMSVEEKEKNPKAETTEGYLKTIPMKDAWKNAWVNFTEENKNEFKNIPNFCPIIFEEITGIII